MPETLKLPAEAEIIIEGCRRVGQLAEAILGLVDVRDTCQPGQGNFEARYLEARLEITQSALVSNDEDNPIALQIIKPKNEFAERFYWLYEIRYRPDLKFPRTHIFIYLYKTDSPYYPSLICRLGPYADNRTLSITEIEAVKTDLDSILSSLKPTSDEVIRTAPGGQSLLGL